MAYDAGGTFNSSLFGRFVTFARAQVPLLDSRVAHLTAELLRVGVYVMRFTNGIPVGFVAQPAGSYLSRLTAAYEVLGGDPMYDLQIRLLGDPVFLQKGTDTKSPTMYSNGEPKPAPGLADADSQVLMVKARGVFQEGIRHGRDRLERKIRRTVDYGDQLQAEINAIKLIRQGVTVDGSLENIIQQVQQLFTDGLYRAIYDDQGKDPFGKLVNAPFASYNPGGGKPASDGPERGPDGVVEPGTG